ncbi:MAG TPA: hypothetical protein VE734_01860 [Terriglobales bacterium]|nr:hypothetical protein [Terriglobales bacterium]
MLQPASIIRRCNSSVAFPDVGSAVAHSAAAFVLAYEAAATESLLFDRAVLRVVFPARAWGHGKGKFRSIGLRDT